jgi:heparanase 1
MVRYAADELVGPRGAFAYDLSFARFDEFLNFAKRAELEAVFAVSAGPSSRNESGAWRPDNLRRLLAHLDRSDNRVAVWELGNEVNAYPFIHGLRTHISPAQYARDFELFAGEIHNHDGEARVAGPSSAIWPVVGEAFPFLEDFGRLSPGSIDALTYHYYPTQSSRGPVATRRARVQALLSGSRLDDTRRWAELALSVRDRFLSENTEVWLAETGHAQFGGEVGLSDRHVASLWWLDQLSLLAQIDVSTVIRQTLIGSDYGLLDYRSGEPNPDFYATLLFRGLVGPAGIACTVSPRARGRIRSYAWENRRDSRQITILLINLRRVPSARPVLPGGERIVRRFTVSADQPKSKHPELNGLRLTDLTAESLAAAIANGDRVGDGGSDTLHRALPPLSYTFLVLERT